MRIAFLCKRYYTAKDVILDRYGRLFELPNQLAQLGHDVQAWSLDYRAGTDGQWEYPVGQGALNWNSYAVGGVRAGRLFGYPRRLFRQLTDFQPDLVLGASDIPHVALAAWLGHQLNVPSVIDLYDNFESFGQAHIPGFKALFHRAVHRADLVVTASQMLKNKVQSAYEPPNLVLVMPNGIDKNIFFPGPRAQARKALGLPAHARLIGTAGGLSRMKGLDTVYTAWRKMQAKHSDLHLILAGPIEKGLSPPEGPRVHYLGELPQFQIAQLFRALDVGIISIPDTSFGRYCFPQKAYEMLACSLPIVVADVGEMSTLFASYPNVLFKASDHDALAAVVSHQLDAAVRPMLPVRDWRTLVREIEPQLAYTADRPSLLES